MLTAVCPTSHDADATPGAVLVEMDGIEELHRELTDRPCPFFDPAIGSRSLGPTTQVIAPSSSRLRFFERAQ